MEESKSPEHDSEKEIAYQRDIIPHPAIVAEINEKEKKAYITIKKTDRYPSCDDVVESLKAYGISYWIDEDTIRKELEKGNTDKPFVAAFAKDGKLEIRVEKHDKSAYFLLSPSYGGKEITLNDIQIKISEFGIVFGVDYDTINTAFSEKIYDKPVLFARCKEPVNGADGRIEYAFPLEFKMTPKEIDGNKIDYKDLQMIFSVCKGDIIARKIPPTPGEAGCTITGKTIPAKPGKDILLSAGRNAQLSEDSLSILSLIDGQPILKGNTVFVEPVLLVQDDVDYSIGNIDFKGSVKILGSVTSGFSVKATENIEIDGVVEDCFIEAGRDIHIKGGVLGAEKGSIIAGRDIHMSFVENCHIEAARNIFVGDVLNSQISAGDTIDVILGKGRVFGGKLNARNLVVTNILGSGAAEKTQVSVGFEPKTIEKLKNLKETLTKVKHTHDEIQKHIGTLEKLNTISVLPEEKEILYKRLVMTEEELRHQVEELKGKIEMIESTMTKAVQPLVKIRKTCYPNVRITIGRLVFDCFEEYNSAVFHEENNKIEVNVYENFA